MKHYYPKADLSAALASVAKDYATKRTEENRRVMVDLLTKCYYERTPLFFPYNPSKEEDYLKYVTVKFQGKLYFLFFIHSEDMLDTQFVSASQTDVTTMLNYLYDYQDEHGISGIAFHTGKDSFPCLVSLHDCLQIAEKYHSIYAAVQSYRFTAKLANLMHPSI